MGKATELTRRRNSKLPRLRISRLRLGVAPFLELATITARLVVVLVAGAERRRYQWPRQKVPVLLGCPKEWAKDH